MKKYLYLYLLLTVLIFGKTFKNIEFTGDIDLITGEFDRSTLLKICHIEYPPIYKIWKSDPTFEESQIDDFIEYIDKYAHSMGYYKVEVKSSTDEDTIYIAVKKNEAIKITSLNITQEFEVFSQLEQGTRFRTIDFTETKNKIRDFLEGHGYPRFKMNAKAFVDIDLYEVKVKITVNKGEKYFFGKTDINNSSQIDDERIREKIIYEEGELYNVLKLEESYESIYRLGVFEEIKMEADFNNSEGRSPIHIRLKEGETKEIASNLGYDTQDGVRGGVEYIDHNFFGNLREFKAGLQISQRGQTAYTGFYDPWVRFPILGRMGFRNDVRFSKWDYDAYVERLFVERVTFNKSFIGLDHFFGFQLEHSDVSSDIPLFFSGKNLINSLFYRVVIDGRDSEMDAKDGYYTSLSIEKAMKQLGSDIDYLKLEAEVRYIKSFEPMVFAGKIKVGTISEKTPPFKHFFLGGAMSNRGYEYRDLGEHTGIYPIGGVSMIDASIEGRYSVTENFSTVGFFDFSKLSQDVNNFSGAWYTSFGTGVRYNSIIGPLRLDVGYPTEGGFALHLGIGQVF